MRMSKDWRMGKELGVNILRTRKVGRGRMATVGALAASLPQGKCGTSPAHSIAAAIRRALSTKAVAGPVKTFAEMSPEEQEEMRRLYETR
jgi:hypothetical protein